jgi:hypothetical protein
VSEIGPAYMDLGDRGDPDPEGLRAEAQTVKDLSLRLLGTFNRYLRGHRESPFPGTLMGVLNFTHVVCSDQADRMGLSPDQRESYYRVAVRSLVSSMQDELHRLTTVADAPADAPTTPEGAN